MSESTFSIAGQSLIGAASMNGENGVFKGVNARTGEALEPAFGGASASDLARACALAEAAFDLYRETSLEARAVFLETIGQQIESIGDALIERCMAETGLPRARLEGERARTTGQLKLFAAVLRQGDYVDARIDPAQPERKPMPRVDLRLRNIAVGPVAVFGASNFPLAFSVAGGDTASALAAGCPVVVKAHSAHPGTSELVGRAIQRAVAQCGLPEGVFSLLFDSGIDIGRALVADPRIKAVGFTGSRAAGVALMKIANARKEPIPVYAEMSAINPVVLLPHALAARGELIARQFAAALTLGAGQFCTNPGLVLAVEGETLRAFELAAGAALADAAAQTMLTPRIHANYCAGVERLSRTAQVESLAASEQDNKQDKMQGGPFDAQPALFAASAQAFLADEALRAEVFGPASLIVRCSDLNELHAVLDSIEGQLTVSVHLEPADHEACRTILPTLERKAGRVLANGLGTGVEVGYAMVHGGPFPATSDARTTSVGGRAIERFLRPVSYQDWPDDLLPAALRGANPQRLARRVNGVLRREDCGH
ncbi:NADP-dependent aldehyde dehydrogenase [Paraburkholderia bannensis]|uniref:2,5-dioxovalerate dehydrogenase n=1 Tax=Paraburkholderia bannensis TaxID=765414 RepID=A0A7W9TZ16_9BURK|nr:MULTISPECIES: aldehyde dehydrogenase (NADP(+)) [Paraburkholderia]MBB3258998.1 NADP-dependent aldehyde dehydrogenase [Paraburkholderia sp. WP4_3_2]MBB6104012.1 NADP-dependent aldehyde dehydrogenase [Paraburkholderia bannensis]